MLRKLLFFVALILATSALLQAQTGTLAGKITDKATKEAIPFVNLIVEMGGKQMGGATTDIDGNYIIKPLNPGRYNLKASFVGYKPIMITDIVVSPDKITKQDIFMEATATTLNLDVEVIAYKVPLVEADQTSSGQTLTSDEITKMPGRDATSVAILTGGVFSQDGTMGSVRGQRDEATNIYIDGIRVRGSAKVPQQAIDQVSMVTGGIPAQYGDATGGIMSITTKGASAKFGGGLEYLTSQFTDKFGYHLLSFSVQGPLLRDSSKNVAKIGFFLSGEAGTAKDSRPSYIGYYHVKDEKLKEIEKNPIKAEKGAFLAKYNADFLRKDDLEHIDAKLNSRRYNGSLAAKLDFKLSPSMTAILGASGDFDLGRVFQLENMLMNSENNPYSQSVKGRVFARLSQRFNTGNDSKALFKNIYYSIQVDYTKTYYKIQDYRNKDNFMAYGYLGKFKVKNMPNYESFAGFGPDSVYYRKYYVFKGMQDTLVTYERSDLNPIYANYASQFFSQYDPLSPQYRSFTSIGLANGIFNGQLPNGNGQSHEGCWSLPGSPYNYYQKSETDMYGVNAVFSFDIQKHNIQLGMQYEQRTDRAFTIRPLGLWNQMRLLANKHIQQLNTSNPIRSFKDINGDGVNDTVFDYNFAYDAQTQSLFDINLRKKLGKPVDGTEFINIDELDPSTFTLDMFAADELWNGGNTFVSYYGYTYDGKKQSSKPSFDDFFDKKDDKGFKTRPIDAFRPNYLAFYGQDKFYFDDLIFNIGLRVDRFDANQMVLKDRYLMYDAKTVGEFTHFADGTKIKHPDNIKDDFVPYVDNIENPTAIVAYRYKDKYYTPGGSEITDYQTIRQMALVGTFKPVLKDPKQENVNSSAFKDYKPQWVFMPRIAFSFPISDEANFMANYNVLTKRPSEGWRMDPSQYYFIHAGSIYLNNPDLKPEKTISYEIGFQQKLTKRSALKLNTYYSEIRDQIQRYYYLGAYPRSYIGYNNIDFGTVKGFILAYDLRRSGNVRLITNYTLSFAEGTGSTASSALGLIRSGQANLRSTSYLDYDRRHAFNLNVDFRYGEGKDYNGPTSKKANGEVIRWLENFGINTTFMAGSGVPYTKSARIYSGITGWGTSQIAGGLNTARQPWEIVVNTKIDRDFTLGKTKNYSLNIYAEIFNLLNKKNILAVYDATGQPDDDGVLAASEFESYIAAQWDPQSFREMYEIRSMYGIRGGSESYFSNFAMPRRVRLGVIFSF